MLDAVVIGSGPNGLVAANLLADAGWDVLVLEAQPTPGGAVRSAELTKPGYVHDVFSAFYPLGAASPVLRELELERHGLVWRHAPVVVAHPLADGECAALYRDVDQTAASLGGVDGDAWRSLMSLWDRLGDDLVSALLRPFPPVGAGARLLGRLRPSEVREVARMALLPVRRLADEWFSGPGGGLLLAGNALHADLPPEAPGSGIFGLILCGLGQTVGFPVPEGGAGALTAALLRRFQGQVRTDAPVVGIDVRDGRAVAVRTAAGETIPVRRAVLADVGAPALYDSLLPEGTPRPRLMERFEYDSGTVKVDWALDGDIPWTAPAARQAGTVHLADSMDHLTDVAAALAKKQVPADPFLLLGQMHVADPTRRPTAWAYTHVPFGHAFGPGGLEGFADRMEERIERFAPGFRDTAVARHVMGPGDLESRDANLVSGAINGGTANLYQQLVFRHGPRTPVDGLYLASASAHPGGGVHGACGANAATAALSRRRPWTALSSRLR